MCISLTISLIARIACFFNGRASENSITDLPLRHLQPMGDHPPDSRHCVQVFNLNDSMIEVVL